MTDGLANRNESQPLFFFRVGFMFRVLCFLFFVSCRLYCSSFSAFLSVCRPCYCSTTRQGVDTRFALVLSRFPLGVSCRLPLLWWSLLFYHGFSYARVCEGRPVVGSTSVCIQREEEHVRFRLKRLFFLHFMGVNVGSSCYLAGGVGYMLRFCVASDLA